MEYSYYLIYRESKRGGEILFNVGTKERTSTLIRLGGRRIRETSNEILQILSRAGCIIPIQTGHTRIYSLRDDVGPVIGTYLILIRRARKMDYWIDFLNELLMGKYARFGRTFAMFLEMMIDLSKGMPAGRAYNLSPIIVSAFSPALKELVRGLEKKVRFK